MGLLVVNINPMQWMFGDEIDQDRLAMTTTMRMAMVSPNCRMETVPAHLGRG